MQSLFACVSSGRLHHDGASEDALGGAIVGATNGGCFESSEEARLMGLLIRNGTVVTAEKTFAADILMEGETIKEVRAGIPAAPGLHTLDASGMLLLPGGIDPHTHLDLPFGGTSSSDDFETGTRAAALGGTTTIVDFAVQYRGQSLNEALDAWFRKAEGKAAIDYGFHMIVTDLPDERLPELNGLIN